MKTMAYTTPTIEKIADYTEATHGIRRGRSYDLNHARFTIINLW